jgi:hypothetical protein
VKATRLHTDIHGLRRIGNPIRPVGPMAGRGLIRNPCASVDIRVHPCCRECRSRSADRCRSTRGGLAFGGCRLRGLPLPLFLRAPQRRVSLGAGAGVHSLRTMFAYCFSNWDGRRFFDRLRETRKEEQARPGICSSPCFRGLSRRRRKPYSMPAAYPSSPAGSADRSRSNPSPKPINAPALSHDWTPGAPLPWGRPRVLRRWTGSGNARSGLCRPPAA